MKATKTGNNVKTAGNQAEEKKALNGIEANGAPENERSGRSRLRSSTRNQNNQNPNIKQNVNATPKPNDRIKSNNVQNGTLKSQNAKDVKSNKVKENVEQNGHKTPNNEAKKPAQDQPATPKKLGRPSAPQTKEPTPSKKVNNQSNKKPSPQKASKTDEKIVEQKAGTKPNTTPKQPSSQPVANSKISKQSSNKNSATKSTQKTVTVEKDNTGNQEKNQKEKVKEEPKKDNKIISTQEKEEKKTMSNVNNEPSDETLLTKRSFVSMTGASPAPAFDAKANPIGAIMMQSLNQSHNTQRRRDIKQNYKAKLPLDKLIEEHEKKKQQVKELIDKRVQLLDSIKGLWDQIGVRQGLQVDFDMHLNLLEKNETGQEDGEDNKIVIDQAGGSEQTVQKSLFIDQSEVYRKHPSVTGSAQVTSGKTHWDFLLREMVWMSEDFVRESKKRTDDGKKMVRICKRHIHEKHVAKERMQREYKVELKRKSKFMSTIVQQYWKSCEKIVKHNYNVEYEKKRQQMRTKKLENFVSKHLKLSVKVAESLNTKQYVQSSLYKPNENDQQMKNQGGALAIEPAAEKQNESASANDEAENQSLAEKTVEMAQCFQPTGHTLDNAQVNTEVPFLLRGSLREYQIIGLDWLVTLHNRRLNGILADEMGLGKTIQTIAMLASLACDKGVWGPHLIVVPTTIIMNWEMEFKRWCPGFKILTYFGSQKERKIKRHGWSKENSFHVCITSYKLVIQDHFAFRRKKWYYMILDEAQNIKNFKSQRWQTLLRFNTKRRLLLTGTPLQNDVMELWSLMHFLMPNIFSNQQDFKEWFSNPFSQSINQNKSLNLRVVQKLQSILRPFLLRRMKRDVEKQLPEKIEHIIQCNLSRRQRLLYDEYINLDKTRNCLADSDFFSIMSVLMQLRKVCNHPDLFEARTIESPFILTDEDRISYSFPTFMLKQLHNSAFEKDLDLSNLNFRLIDHEERSSAICERQKQLMPAVSLASVIYSNRNLIGSNDNIYRNNKISTFHMMTRPANDGMAIQQKHYTSNNLLQKPNAKGLGVTIPNIMPFDSNINYRMQYHKIPKYLNAACIPFTQQDFSIQSYDQMRYSSYEEGPFAGVTQYKSAIQSEEQKQMLVNLSRKLALWHSADRQNRLQLLHGHPVFGSDLRSAINIKLVCGDIFDQKTFKYINWMRYRIYKQKSKESASPSYEYIINNIYEIPQTVFNPFYRRGGRPEVPVQRVVVTEWPTLTEPEIEKINSTNLLIKEITQKTRLALRLKKEQREEKERLERLRQPKRVQRRKEIEIEEKSVQFNIYIDLKAIREQEEKEASKQEDQVMNDEQKNDNENQEQKEINDDWQEPKDDLTNEDPENTNNDQQQIIDNNAENNEQKIDKEMKDEQEKIEQKVEQINPDSKSENCSADKKVEKCSDKQQAEEDSEGNPNVVCKEETIIKITKKTKIYEEIITYEQYLKEQEENQKKKSPSSILDQNKIQTDQSLQLLKIQEQSENIRSLSRQKSIDQQPSDGKNNFILSSSYKNTDTLKNMIISPLQRGSQMEEIIKNFKVIVPKCVAKPVEFLPSKVYIKYQKERAYEQFLHQKLMQHKNVNQSLKYSNILFFPHKNLVQYDCGKLQKMAQLLKTLYNKGSKVIIFTQMTKMLDIFEQFLNLHGYIYVRLDGSVKTENRQKLVDRFNYNRKIFCFISSTRCGGVGINLTGADCVIFYDTDWNPAMDKQAQDRCHRIGQTKTVHIYRLISINTIEENIFKKSLQKRELGGMIIEGNFNQEFFQKVSVKDILTMNDFGANSSSLLPVPKKFDVFKEEKIVFGEHMTNDEIILKPEGADDANQQNEMDEDGGDVDFEANSQDLEIQAAEMERRRQEDQYRRRFEEALIRIEDQEDVAAMRDAQQEIHENDDDLREFNAENVEGDLLDEQQPLPNLQTEGLTEEQEAMLRKQRELELLELNKQKEILGKQKINDGIGLTQGEMRKHESIDWDDNNNLNKVTKSCLNYFQEHFSFEEYLDERAKKDSKFVNIVDDEKKEGENSQNTQDQNNDKNSDVSEFSLSAMSDDQNDAEQSTQYGSTANKSAAKKKWNRSTAQEFYNQTKVDIDAQLYCPQFQYTGPSCIPLQFTSQKRNLGRQDDQQIPPPEDLEKPPQDNDLFSEQQQEKEQLSQQQPNNDNQENPINDAINNEQIEQIATEQANIAQTEQINDKQERNIDQDNQAIADNEQPPSQQLNTFQQSQEDKIMMLDDQQWTQEEQEQQQHQQDLDSAMMDEYISDYRQDDNDQENQNQIDEKQQGKQEQNEQEIDQQMIEEGD